MAEFKKNIQQHPGRYIGVLKDTDADTTYTAGNGLDLSGTEFRLDLKSNAGLAIDSTELALSLSDNGITGVLPNGNVAQDLTIAGGTINNTPIGASTANTISGTTIDASTDFTVGTTVITDDQIQFTPSTSDTVTISASANGVLDITTHDASGSKGANVTINAVGTAEIAAAGTITLDTAGDIEFEPGGVLRYVNNVGIYRGTNVGYYSDTFIPVMPVDFMYGDDNRNAPSMGLNGQFAQNNSFRVKLYAQKIIPMGYTATQCIVYGTDTDGDAEFICWEGDITGGTPAQRCNATAVGSTATFATAHSNIVGDGEKFVVIQYIPGDSIVDTVKGAKITITRTT
jgi:hypothetical protein